MSVLCLELVSDTPWLGLAFLDSSLIPSSTLHFNCSKLFSLFPKGGSTTAFCACCSPGPRCLFLADFVFKPDNAMVPLAQRTIPEPINQNHCDFFVHSFLRNISEMWYYHGYAPLLEWWTPSPLKSCASLDRAFLDQETVRFIPLSLLPQQRHSLM